ncbi:hypothetical protein [Halorubrum sp. F4]|uniref:hypothetical protein n=1 Tax=Halorubrum sp. F4 TaxID=2989715 RepID=UPI00247FF852|nr:hypothetical protein [Halorubrum sp. F4]
MSDDIQEGISGWGDLRPPSIIREFIQNPRRLIVGAVLTTLLESAFSVVSRFIDALLLIFGGSQPFVFDAPGETLGIADLPVAIAATIGTAGGSLGRSILSAIRTLNGELFLAADAAGPFSPIVVTAIVVVEILVVLAIVRRIVYVVADLLQLGGLTE